MSDIVVPDWMTTDKALEHIRNSLAFMGGDLNVAAFFVVKDEIERLRAPTGEVEVQEVLERVVSCNTLAQFWDVQGEAVAALAALAALRTCATDGAEPPETERDVTDAALADRLEAWADADEHDINYSTREEFRADLRQAAAILRGATPDGWVCRGKCEPSPCWMFGRGTPEDGKCPDCAYPLDPVYLGTAPVEDGWNGATQTSPWGTAPVEEES